MPIEPSPEPSPETSAPTEAVTPLSVLIIEDDESIGYLIGFVLEREGYKVDWKQGGYEAAAFIQRNAPPSVVLLDVNLPEVDGYGLLTIMRANPLWQQTPVLMLTSMSQAKDVAKAKAGGANDYLLKPFKPLELVSRVYKLAQPLPAVDAQEATVATESADELIPKPRVYRRRV